MIRAILHRCYPKRQTLDYAQINNARIWAQTIVDKARRTGTDPTDLVSAERVPNLIRTLDFDSENILDEAIETADNLFYDVLNDCDGNSELLTFLHQLNQKDKAFTYKISFNKSNQIS